VTDDQKHWWLAMGFTESCSAEAVRFSAPYTACNGQFGRITEMGVAMSTLFTAGASMLVAGKPITVDNEVVWSAYPADVELLRPLNSRHPICFRLSRYRLKRKRRLI
jgi:hypothetical protein